MSLALVQGYSSADEEEENFRFLNSSSDDDDEAAVTDNVNSPFDLPKLSTGSVLPSAFDAFSEITGPPEFLNNCVEEQPSGRRGGRRNRKEKKDLPSGAVVEAKPQLVGIHERVRSDIETSNLSPLSSSSVQPSMQVGVKRVATATIPDKEDASELLKLCLQCGIPKTYSNARGIVCPVCGDRPPVDSNMEVEKKKGSVIKDKEKSKRMKGQSSHATWKSETEMHLRQQFD